jgi:hypothetical protein
MLKQTNIVIVNVLQAYLRTVIMWVGLQITVIGDEDTQYFSFYMG